MRLAGQVAFVTGTAGGIGSAIAALFAAEGARVFTADIQAGGDFALDIADRPAVDAAVARIVAEAGRLDIAVSAGALLGGTGAFLDVTLADWERYIGVNVTGTFHVCQAAARAMVAGGRGGALVTVGSVNSMAAERDAAQYVTSKHGVLGLTRAMAVELAQHGIRANMVAPGAITVPRNAALFASPAFEREFRARVPQRRAGVAADIAHAALYLAEPTSGYVTGSVVTVDGGLLNQIWSPDL